MKKGSVAITYRQEEQINTLHFTYDALGNKLQKTVAAFGPTTTTDYANGLLYKNGQLQFASHPEGYLEPTENGTLEYVYQYTDHLGNIRLSYKKGSSDELIVVEENNYYPLRDET